MYQGRTAMLPKMIIKMIIKMKHPRKNIKADIFY